MATPLTAHRLDQVAFFNAFLAAFNLPSCRATLDMRALTSFLSAFTFAFFFLSHGDFSYLQKGLLVRPIVVLLEKITDKAPYFARSARVERIAERNKTIPVRLGNSNNQLTVFQVLFLRFFLFGQLGVSLYEYIMLLYCSSFVYTL